MYKQKTPFYLLLTLVVSFFASIKDVQAAPLQQNNAIQQFGAWFVRCNGDLNCSMYAEVVDQNSQRVVSRLTIIAPNNQENLRVATLSPLGVLLPQAAAISLDGAIKQRVNFVLCTNEGCFAEDNMSQGLIAAMSAATKINVYYQLQNSQQLNISISRTGFDAAYAELKQLHASIRQKVQQQ